MEWVRHVCRGNGSLHQLTAHCSSLGHWQTVDRLLRHPDQILRVWCQECSETKTTSLVSSARNVNYLVPLLCVWNFWMCVEGIYLYNLQDWVKSLVPFVLFCVFCVCRCGTGAVVLLWEVTLEVVSVNGEATSYYLDSCSHLVQEADGVRVVGSICHDLLQKVSRYSLFTLLVYCT